MSEVSLDKKRIATNTIMLYIRMFVAMLIGIYTSRIIIQSLGVSDYGLYGVVGGVVTILIFVNNTLSSGTQRFLNFALGEKDEEKLKKVFSNALLLHFIIGICFFILSETIGLWFVYNKLNIPENRLYSAFWVFQFSTISVTILSIFVPFSSAIVAHERFKVYAYMSIFDVTMNLITALLLKYVGSNKLILYSFLVLTVNSLTTFIYYLYCVKSFRECRLKLCFHKDLFREMVSFSGWNIIGCGAVTLQNQGVNIVLNIYFGTIVNGARSIALLVNQKVLQFTSGFQTAINPQIVKLYAAGNKKELFSLIINNAKFGAFLFLVIAVPVCVEIKYILQIWLGTVPDITISLILIVMFQTLIQVMTRPVVMLVHAVGRMKMVNISAGGALLLILPISLFLAHIGCDVITIYLVNLIPWFLETFFELYYERKYCDFPIKRFYTKVYGSVFPIGLLMVLASILFKYIIMTTLKTSMFLQFLICGSFSFFISCLIVYKIGFTPSQRLKIRATMNSKVNSIRKCFLLLLP